MINKKYTTLWNFSFQNSFSDVIHLICLAILMWRPKVHRQPVQVGNHVASDQGLHCLLKE